MFADENVLQHRREFSDNSFPTGRTIREAAISATIELRRKGLPATELFYAAAKAKDWETREGCLLALDGVPDMSNDWRQLLVRALHDKEDRVFSLAVRAGQKLDPSPELIEALAMALQRESRKAQAADALAAFGPASEPAVSKLIAALEAGGCELEVTHCLGCIGPDAQPALRSIRECLASNDEVLRIAAAHAIWRISKQADIVLGVYVDLLNSDENRASVCQRLGEMRSEAAGVVPELLQALGKGTLSDVGIIRALGEIGSAAESALPVLECLAGDPRPQTSVLAVALTLAA